MIPFEIKASNIAALIKNKNEIKNINANGFRLINAWATTANAITERHNIYSCTISNIPTNTGIGAISVITPYKRSGIVKK